MFGFSFFFLFLPLSLFFSHLYQLFACWGSQEKFGWRMASQTVENQTSLDTIQDYSYDNWYINEPEGGQESPPEP